MLQLTNQTPFAAERAALVDPAGNQTWVVVVKASFTIKPGARPEIAAEQEPVCQAPLYAGEPGKSSLLREAELVTEHPGTDVTLLGTAYSPEAKAVKTLDVALRVGAVSRTLRVFGDRTWRSDGESVSASEPAAWTRMPIQYERAFGGADPEDITPRASEPRNPIGVGFGSQARQLIGTPLPNIEDPLQPISSWESRPPPVGFGPIPGMWSPRREFAGTFDESWRKERMPLLPVDYDPRHAQSAHPDLVAGQPLRGGEEVVLVNLTPSGNLSFLLPRVPLTLLTRTRTGRLLMQPQLDRVIIEPDANKVVVVYRASLNCGSRVREIVGTVVDMKRQLGRRGAA